MEIVIQTVLFLISIGLFVISFFQFKERGFLLNNAYLFASEQERKTMDKKPHYQQSGITFGMLGVIFLLIALEMLLRTGWLYYIVWTVAFIVIVYAIASSIMGVTKSHKR